LIGSYSNSRRKSDFRFVPIVLLLLCFSLYAQNYPARPSGPVGDYAGIIDKADQEKITVVAQALWEQAGFALVVATVPSLDGMTIDDYAPELYKQWGIGKKGRDEGALVLLSLDPRKVRIEVGYGAEGYLNDALVGRMIDDYGVPAFRNNDFSKGLAAVSLAIAGQVEREKGISLTLPSGYAPPVSPPVNVKISLFKLIAGLLVLLFMLGTPFGRTILWTMLAMSLLGGGRGGRGGGFGGGFGGGGFGGGFGGGMSGGGGASRGF
jgi:uncharacterized protein